MPQGRWRVCVYKTAIPHCLRPDPLDAAMAEALLSPRGPKLLNTPATVYWNQMASPRTMECFLKRVSLWEG